MHGCGGRDDTHLDEVAYGGWAKACEEAGWPLCGNNMSCARQEIELLVGGVDLNACLHDVNGCKAKTINEQAKAR